MDTEYRHALGCVVGAFCGDAAGAPLEFKRDILESDLEQALEMKGKGAWDVGPGQVTDDSELALALANGLVDGNGVLDLDAIVKYYGRWIESKPFDLGYTLKAALGGIDQLNPKADPVIARAKEINVKSLSNGSLMRITPMAIWARHLSDENLEKAVRVETSLTHPNEIVQQASKSKHLILSFGDRRKSFEATKAFAIKRKFETIVEWMNLADNPLGEMVTDCQKDIGCAKHGFVWGMHLLLANCDFKEGLTRILSEGGDTDTNSCIVGGLIGAAVGYSGLPDKMKDALFNFNGYKNLEGIKRPTWLLAGRCVLRMVNLIDRIAPTSLTIQSSK